MARNKATNEVYGQCMVSHSLKHWVHFNRARENIDHGSGQEAAVGAKYLQVFWRARARATDTGPLPRNI